MRIALAVLRRDRRSQVATVLVALGVMIAVSLVLWLLAAPNGLQARADRTAWRDFWTNEGGKSTISVATTRDVYRGQLIERFDVARNEPGDVPVAKGIARYPESGEVLLSPALANLVREAPAENLGNRFPGQVIAELGPEALKYEGELVAIVGHDAVSNGEKTTGLAQDGASYTDDYHGLLFLLTRVGLVVLVVPCLVLVASAARLTAAKRERRLAALRLAGASPRQVVGMTALETAVGAVAGSALGVLLAQPFSHLTAKISWEGGTWYPGDFVSDPVTTGVVAVLAPVLVVLAAIMGLRRVVKEPLAAEQKRKVRSWRLLAIAGAIAVFFFGITVAQTGSGSSRFTVVLLGLGAVALALVLAGPVVTAWVGRFFVGRWQKPSTLLAGRRLSGDPVAAFRGSAGVVIAVFTGSMALTMLPGLETTIPNSDKTWQDNAIVAEEVGVDVTPLRLATSAPIVTMTSGNVGDGSPDHYGATVLVGKCKEVALLMNGLKCGEGPAVYAPAKLQWSHFRGSSRDGEVKAELPAQYETRPFTPAGYRYEAVIDPELLPALQGRVSLVGVPTTPDNREAVHTAFMRALPGAPLTELARGVRGDTLTEDLERATIIGLSIAGVLGGIGAAVAAAGSVIDRRRTFGALIAAGTPIRVLAHALRREVVLPVLAATIAACAAGIVMGLGLLALARGLMGGQDLPLTPWVVAPIAVGLVVALVAALACGPVLRGISPRDYAAE
ncbi:FtsX-like permease family protein [Lentzea sp. JNUCC 0626]|uniref:FtsX-like permease family protein n=1 Tax=Lentzea sp. JNUCC 0626 TaxID=3367513 RepID=UPI0037491183